MGYWNVAKALIRPLIVLTRENVIMPQHKRKKHGRRNRALEGRIFQPHYTQLLFPL